MLGRHNLQTGTRHPRSGFTWAELLVCVVILGLLAALLLPAVRSARPPARRTQCQSNLRNIGIAIQAYATYHKGVVPPLTGGFQVANPHPTKRSGGTIDAPWTVALLPYLEQQTLRDRLYVPPGQTPFSLEFTQKAASQVVEPFLCPDAIIRPEGGLSYVANAGIMAADVWGDTGDSPPHSASRYDLGFNGYGGDNLNQDDLTAVYATGVFWNDPGTGEMPNEQPLAMTLDQISASDGTSQTILLSENLHTRSFDPQAGTGGWISTSLGDLAFGVIVPGKRIDGTFQVSPDETPGGLGISGGLSTSLTLNADPVPAESRINSNLKTAISGQSPRPSSMHLGVVNAAFADGSCKVISEQIDPSVYARLLSPCGGRHGQAVLLDSDF